MKPTTLTATLALTTLTLLTTALGAPTITPNTTTTTFTVAVLSCTENATKCAGGHPGGAVFACKAGAWIAISVCRAYENCVELPVPHCTWARKQRGEEGEEEGRESERERRERGSEY